MDLYRAELGIAWPFRPGWALQVVIPYESKKIRADAEGGLDFHFRDTTPEGLSDLEVLASRDLSGLLSSGHRLTLGAGLTIPTGEIEEDPFKAEEAGLEHQHLQFGTGTFDPLVRLAYGYDRQRWSLDVSAKGRFPLYENRETYRAPEVFTLSAGPRVRLGERVQIGLHYVGLYQERAAWDSATDPNSGYFIQGVQATLPIRISHTLTVSPNVMHGYDLDTRGEGEDVFGLDWLYGLSIVRSF